MALFVAVAKILADKRAVTVRKITAIYLLWGMVQLVTIAEIMSS
jgi:hypothetical protein